MRHLVGMIRASQPGHRRLRQADRQACSLSTPMANCSPRSRSWQGPGAAAGRRLRYRPRQIRRAPTTCSNSAAWRRSPKPAARPRWCTCDGPVRSFCGRRFTSSPIAPSSSPLGPKLTSKCTEAADIDYQVILRGLAFKWQRILFRCWQDRKPTTSSATSSASAHTGLTTPRLPAPRTGCQPLDKPTQISGLCYSTASRWFAWPCFWPQGAEEVNLSSCRQKQVVEHVRERTHRRQYGKADGIDGRQCDFDADRNARALPDSSDGLADRKHVESGQRISAMAEYESVFSSASQLSVEDHCASSTTWRQPFPTTDHPICRRSGFAKSIKDRAD